ncbi:transport protein particle subunit bet5 [Protomyces lactucae-debilis]|uniref:Trafficking protein particle complex subunit n=1 Tax=Protomyces lactucae-debilis TaxID=2754530 RepID=A0A1Y2FSC5_PROLT|nr:transport protein particle subunit bet5 [Protomyces lactucae-debilis]ORY86888.1 transport protein particle subunit bet5 [Protomyces lactucae-debilis]
MIYAFHLFNRQCEPVYTKQWRTSVSTLSRADLNKLLFGTIFSLRNLIRKLSPTGQDGFFSYRTDAYRCHVLETPSLLRFVLITSPEVEGTQMLPVLRSIYESLYTEYVVKNPLSLRDLGALGEQVVGCELFVLALDQFIMTLPTY